MQTRRGSPRTSDPESDEQLMARVRGGEVEAFDALFERYRRRLFGFLFRRCDETAAAEDLFQETWIRVIRARNRFDPRRRFSTWLFQIANNLCRDRVRRLTVDIRKREALHEQAQARSESATASSPELSVALPADLRESLAALPDRLREVLVLRYYHDLSEGEIAEIVGVPRGTVKRLLHAAVKTLRAGVQSDG